MSSKSKKKDKKKSKSKNDKIELKEIEAVESTPQLAVSDTAEVPAKKTKPAAPKASAAPKQKYQVKVISAPAAVVKTDKKYEESLAAELNSVGEDGYDLVCVMPSPADSKKLVAFFKSSK